MSPLFSIFKQNKGLQRTPPTDKKTTDSNQTLYKRVHSPEDDTKNKKEKLHTSGDIQEDQSIQGDQQIQEDQQTKDDQGPEEEYRGSSNKEPESPSLHKLTGILDELAKLARLNRNTRVDMRELILAAQNIATALRDRKTSSIGTETDSPKDRSRLQWKDRVEACTTREQWTALCNQNWPPEAYQRTIFVGPQQINEPATTTLIVTRRGQLLKPEGECLRKQIPTLNRLDPETIPEIVTICSTDTIVGIESTNKTVHLMTLEENGGTESILAAFEELQKKIEGNNDNILVTSLIKEGAVVRKAIELAFSRTGGTWSLITNQGFIKNQLRNNTESLVVAPGEMTYAELIKSVKENVNAEELGVRILSAKKSTTGQLELKVSGKVSALKEKIMERVQGVTMTHKTRMAIMHIKDLEEEVTKEEITAGINHALQDESLGIEVTSIRQDYGNTCRATIKVPTDAAQLLAKKRSVQIGLVSARLWIREEKQKCHKCWEEGHSIRECKGVDRRNQCFKCKAEGHFKSNCPGIPPHRNND